MSETNGGAASLHVLIGYKQHNASATREIAAAIAEENKHHVIAGLPDELNPRLIDPAKAAALLAGLKGKTLAPLGGRVLNLAPGGLRIGTSAPTTVASFSQPFTLTVESEHDAGKTVSARASVPIDCDLARKRAAAARQRTEASQKDVATLTARKEAARNKPDESPATAALYDATQLRFAVAMAWVENAEAVTVCSPQDAAARADLAEAQRIRSASAVPGGRMP